MKIWIKNIEYFEWDVPDELLLLEYTPQQLVDEYFNPTDISVTATSDSYYEVEDVSDGE